MKPKRSRTVENLSLMVSIRTRSPGRRAASARFNRQDHIVLVKHLVVLEIMQQRRRTKFGSLVRKTAVPFD